ncbi:protein-associating with the carboxyl-terminal domain of ezrin-like [Mizuhopecten yessoensis]|uniref:protein-associating with the carboxyl-terminal domain of ezrin-like n=1 Tax=Mizuhopecten yessoensis TaxID=6573 RepID=UPI000B45D206|nr:protein-associating with the carboxyl-terminal domain of ezrin-like [Mizuhopecten yessoensis]
MVNPPIQPLSHLLYPRNLKSLRHPSIVRFLASGDRSSHTYVVAERVVPVLSILETHSSIEICAGLFSVLEGLSFLHEKAGMCHNNISLESVFVTETGQWKLGSMEHACKFGDATPQYLSAARKQRSPKALAPEEREENMKAAPELAFARDVYAFAVMVEELLEKLEDLGDMTKTFELRIQDECLNPDPKARPKLEALLNDRLFRNDFITISRFLQDITLKSQKEKKEFFEDVMERLYKIPEETVGKCLARSLLCRFVLLDVDAKCHLIPNILVPYRDAKRQTPKTGEVAPLFSVSTYRTYMIPEIYRVFHCHDYHIRMTLLTYFPHYIDLFEKENLEETILPQVLLGLRDTNEDLAALSLRSLAELVPLLGRQMVIGGKAKTYFKKGMPKSVKKQHQQSNGDPVFSSIDNITGTKEGVFSSVNDVMGKPLLKDLARLSKSYTVAARESEAESKRKAREQRQQEAMLKKEKRRQERQMKAEKIALSEGDEIVAYSGEDVIEVHTPKLTEGDSHTDGDIAHSGDSLDDEVSHDLDPEDWTGWDESNEDEFDGDDKEFNQFDSEPVLNDRGTKPVINDRGTEHRSAVVDTVDWDSDWTATDKTHEDSSGSDTTYNPRNNLKNNLSKTGKSSSALSLKSGKKPKPKTNTSALGSEYIMEIEVKKIQAEKEVIDFFADMTPDITSTSITAVKEPTTAASVVKETESAATVVKETDDKSKTTPTISLKYTVTETEDTTGDGGWGEDVDWDDSQF